MPFGRRHIDPSAAISAAEHSFDAVFRRYFPSLCYYAGRFLPGEIDPADVVMGSFLKLLEKQDSLRNIEAVSGFLYTTVRNECLQYLRKQRPDVDSLECAPFLDPADESPNAAQLLIHAETLRQLYEQAKALPPQLKVVFQRYFIDGESEQAISQALGKSYHTIRGQRLRVVELLKEKMGVKKK